MSREVAVIIPCHNAAQWLSATLQSLAAQSLAPAEVIVVDDGSTDDSAAIAERMGVRCERQECAGPGAARNAGVRATRAPLVAFLDADDCFAPSKLATQAEHLEQTAAALSCTDAWVVENGERVGRKNAPGVPSELPFVRLVEGNPIICSSVLMRREVFEAVGGFDEDPVLIATEDYDLWLRVARSHKVAYLGEPLVNYRMTPGQLSDDRRFMRGVDRIMEKVCAADSSAQEVVRARRAAVRLDVAYHLARRMEGGEARTYLQEARALGAGWGAMWKTWLRSWL